MISNLFRVAYKCEMRTLQVSSEAYYSCNTKAIMVITPARAGNYQLPPNFYPQSSMQIGFELLRSYSSDTKVQGQSSTT
jgi:hypothetical protein